ncbi:hypothetical protein Fot_29656 [Forsythia ovata]|uniref:Uncharacterized protein n=1 Tax=Forsythia ovata TaxID=205694 RepID=A0ABD1TSH9_9LAMI
MAHKQEVGAKRSEKESAKGAGYEGGGSSRPSTRDEEDVEVLEETALTRKAKRPRTASSKSLQNLATEVDKSTEIAQGSEEPNYNHLVHIRKIIEWRPSNMDPEVFNMIPPHLQRTLTTEVLIDKIAQLEETAECLGVERYDLKGENLNLSSEIDELKGENLKLKSETEEAVKAGVEDFRN